jgi:Fe-S cluster biogenesis protein NfuA
MWISDFGMSLFRNPKSTFRNRKSNLFSILLPKIAKKSALKTTFVSIFKNKKINLMVVENKNNLLFKADRALDDIRPFLKVDGGNVEVVEITENMILRVRWMGNCQSCSMSAMTMKAGIEQAVRSKLPEIRSVEAIR